MTRIKLGMLAAAGLMALSTGVSAADLASVYKAPPPVPAGYSWTGFYIGGHLGGGWAQTEWSGGGGAQPGFVDASYTTGGFLGGAQAGFNYQTGQLVWGIEGDLSSVNIKASSDCFEYYGGGPQSCISQVKWTSTLTGRFGVASNKTLFYAKGGVAWAREEFSNPCPACSNILALR